MLLDALLTGFRGLPAIIAMSLLGHRMAWLQLRVLPRLGLWAQLVDSADLLVIAALSFSAVNFLLAERELVRFAPGADLADVGAIIGLLVLLFKVVLILPVIAACTGCWAWRRPAAAA